MKEQIQIKTSAGNGTLEVRKHSITIIAPKITISPEPVLKE